MNNPTKTLAEGGASAATSTPAQGQATLSAIGDLSIAAAEAVHGSGAVPRGARLLTTALFVTLLYLAASFLAICTLKSSSYVQAFATPLFAVSIAGMIFWRQQVWKLRSRVWQAKVKEAEGIRNSLAHETANGVNAIRANLVGLQEAIPQMALNEHFQQVERALARIDQALVSHDPRRTL